MRKFLVLLLLWVGLYAFASAQSGIGVRGGANLSRFNFTVSPGQGLRVPPQEFAQGFEAGIVGRLMNNRHLGFQVELNYSRKGWLIYPASEMVHQKELEFLQLPLLTVVQLGRGRLKFTAHGGVFMAYLMKYSDIQGPDPEFPAPIRYEQQALRPWQYGVLVGGGPAFQFPFGILQLEARYVHYLSDLLEVNLSRQDDFDTSSPMTTTFGLQWVYMFGGGR